MVLVLLLILALVQQVTLVAIVAYLLVIPFQQLVPQQCAQDTVLAQHQTIAPAIMATLIPIAVLPFAIPFQELIVHPVQEMVFVQHQTLAFVIILMRVPIVDFPFAMVFQPIAQIIIPHYSYVLDKVPVRHQILVRAIQVTLLTTAPFQFALVLWLMTLAQSVHKEMVPALLQTRASVMMALLD